MERTRVCFDNVNLRESGFGATMSSRNGSAGESVDCFCINVNVNSNVQGVSNSILVGSRVSMPDSGVLLSFGDIKIEGPNLAGEDGKMMSYQIWNFWLGILIVILLVAMLLLQIYY
ncbi:hypothetical protein MLD38_020240 [Melastoma candidum]|nr:hypothetical protein MLD38_020240 [Melastoma candidum]